MAILIARGVICAWLVASTVVSAQGAFNYPTLNASATTNLVLNANATFTATALRLTADASQQRGSVWEATPTNVIAGFDTTFTFRITTATSNLFGGDGICFVVQNSIAGTAALGDAGDRLGYAGSTGGPAAIENSLAIELDTYQNALNGDTSNYEVSAHTNGASANDSNEAFSVGRVTTTIAVDDGQIYSMRVLYVPGLLRIYIDNLSVPILTIPYDLVAGGTFLTGGPAPGLNLLNGVAAFAGITGTTNGVTEQHELLSWTWTSAPLPDPCFEGTIGLGVGGPFDVLTIDGSSGGALHTVPVTVTQPFTISLAQPPTTGVPAPFVLWLYAGISGPLDLTPTPYGSLCIVPHIFAPSVPWLATVADSIGTGPQPIFPSVGTPWSQSFLEGLTFPAQFTLQGLILQASGPSTNAAVTNAVVLSFVAAAPPVVNSIVPPVASQGALVTVNGTGFLIGAQLSVAGQSVPILTRTATAITFFMPPSIPCGTTVQITNPDGQFVVRPFNPPPVITATPFTSGPAAGGALYVVTGTGFVPGMVLMFNGVPATITIQTANDASAVNAINAITPPGSVGPVSVILISPSGCSATANYTYL